MKIRNAFLSVLAFAAGSLASYAQLITTPIASPTWIQDIRNHAGDTNMLLAHSGTSSFSLASLDGGANFFTDISGTVGTGPTSIFQVGNNGSFDVRLEIAYITKESMDNNSLGAFGFTTVSATTTADQVLYANYGAASTQAYSIFGSPELTALTFFHNDATWGGAAADADQNNPLFFHIFESTVAESYNYYVISIDDRGTNAVDHNDGVFVVRINTEEVGITAVPEPSTYGLIGAGALLGLVGYRRFKASRKVAA
jgi:hypothetical protein